MARKKKQKLIQQKAQKEMLVRKMREAREQVMGYEQLARVHSAYIAILLKKLGATEDNAVTITASEIREALEKCETRVKAAEGGFSLFVATIE